jgi:hypothetical protein
MQSYTDHSNAKDRSYQSVQSESPKQSLTISGLTKQEESLYIVEGHPTGLLLCAVAKLKGIDFKEISKATGVPVDVVNSIIPVDVVHSIFSQSQAPIFASTTIKKIADVLGIDFERLRFTSDRVHTFDLKNIGLFVSKEIAHRYLRGVGLLARGCKLGHTKISKPFSLASASLCVAQSKCFRGIFFDSGSMKLAPELLVDSGWARKSRTGSELSISNKELSTAILRRDITPVEFDELFMGSAALTWDDVRMQARIAGVSKLELVSFIKTMAGKELDSNEFAEVLVPVSGEENPEQAVPPLNHLYATEGLGAKSPLAAGDESDSAAFTLRLVENANVAKFGTR